MYFRKQLLFILLTLMVGCKGRGQEEMAASFPIVTPPTMLESVQARSEYIALHFWDSFANPERDIIRDTSLVGGVDRTEVEQKFADWASCLSMVDFPVAVRSMENMFHKVSECERKDTLSNIFDNMNVLVQKYLYDPNSPLRNEDLYGTYASMLSVSPLVSETDRSIYAYDAGMCAKNRIGTKATDFRFSDIKGRVRTLYDIKADWILLFFSNPGCVACMDIIEGIKSSQIVDYMISNGELAVLNIYIDEDLESWKSYMQIYPDNWYNGYDPDYIIRTDLLYNVRAIPSLYLLDKDKKVVMKDAVPENVFSFFNAYIQQGL